MQTVQTHADSAMAVAEGLLQVEAIKINLESPFTWSSGWQSPVYCDNRLSLSYPNLRKQIKDFMVSAIQENFPSCDCIAGVATAGIPQGALVADALGLPFIYVRPEAKSHGMRNQIEGRVESWKNVVMIEDLVSTGGSSLKAIQALAVAGMYVTGMVAIFTYGLAIAEANFKREGVSLVTLSDFSHLVQAAERQDTLSEEEVNNLKAWWVDPANWKK